MTLHTWHWVGRRLSYCLTSISSGSSGSTLQWLNSSILIAEMLLLLQYATLTELCYFTTYDLLFYWWASGDLKEQLLYEGPSLRAVWNLKTVTVSFLVHLKSSQLLESCRGFWNLARLTDIVNSMLSCCSLVYMLIIANDQKGVLPPRTVSFQFSVLVTFSDM